MVRRVLRVGAALRDLQIVVMRPPLRVGGALRAPRRQSQLRSQARCALLSAATPRMMGLRPQTARSTDTSPYVERRMRPG